MSESARAPRLYLVTDRGRTHGRPLLEVIHRALAGGVDTVQLRERDLDTRELVLLARDALELCRKHQARLLINDRIDVALAVGADGVHLPASSFSPADARRLLGADGWIGVSTHSHHEARTALAEGADFVVYGPIFDTESKRPYGAPLGVESLNELCRGGTGPVVAIGGINAGRASQLRAAGAHGIAVIGAILEAPDPQAAASDLCA